MRKFELLTLALTIGAGSLFAASVDVSGEPELDAEYELEEILEEAYGDSDFYGELQKENQEQLKVINYWSKNLNNATIIDDKHGLEVFEIFLMDNYKNNLEDDGFMLTNGINEELSDSCKKVCNAI
jgi:hypothetical protein